MCKQFLRKIYKLKSVKDFREGKSPKVIIIGLFIFGLILIFFPILFTNLKLVSLDYSNTGEIGDIIGGTTTPFIAFAGVLLTFLAFWIQYKANIELRKDIEVERFENKYYELLKLHSENVKDMDIANKYFGRKCFPKMFKELKFIFYVFKSIQEKSSYHQINESYSDEDIMNSSYKVFFFGIGEESDNTIEKLSNEKDLSILTPVKIKLKEFQNNFEHWEDERKGKKHFQPSKNNEDLVHENINYFNCKIKLKDGSIREFDTDYYPFDGNSNRLSHYFRHLFQTVKFIVSNDSFINDKKINYLRTIRAQLSNHEQLLLYYNAFSDFGKPWLTNEYLTKYKMIHNIPLSLANFGITPDKKFEKEILEYRKHGVELFEWDEFKK